jgi:hypothetical protein
MSRKLLPALAVLLLLLSPTPSSAIYNCYDYVFWKITGYDAHPPVPIKPDPQVGNNWPNCLNDPNGLTCIEDVLKSRGTYATPRWRNSSQALPRLAPGDILYLPIGHVAHVDGFNYDRDPDGSLEPKDRPMISHWLPIPFSWNKSYVTVNERDIHGFPYPIVGTANPDARGGYSPKDTLQQLVAKTHQSASDYILYKKLRLDVKIVVNDPKDTPIGGAEVIVAGQTKRTGIDARRGTGGHVLFELDPATYANRDLPIVIRRTGYKDDRRTLFASQMQPSAEFIEYTLNLEARDLDELIRELEAQLEKKRSEMKPPCDDMNKALKDIVDAYIKAYAVNYYSNKLKPEAQKAQVDCRTVSGLRAQIQAAASAAETKSATLNGLIDQANAVVCNTKADEARLNALWSQIQPLSWDVYNNARQADSLNRKLQGILDLANKVYETLNPSPASVLMGQPPLLANSLKSDLDRMNDINSRLFQPARTKMMTLRPECVRAHDRAPDTVQIAADAQGIPSDPRVATFRAHVAAIKPKKGQPCADEELEKQVNELIHQTAQAEPSTRKRIEEMRAMPICAGQSAEDGAVARSKAAWPVIQKLSDSHLIVKMNNCKTSIAKKPPAPAPGSATKPLPPSGPIPMRIDRMEPPEKDHPTVFVGEKMVFKAVVEDATYGNDALRPQGGYAFRWKVDGKNYGDGKYYGDTPTFFAANPGTHTVEVDFVWGDPRTANVKSIGHATKKVTILKKEKERYANVQVPHGKWISSGLSAKKGDYFEVYGSGAYTCKDGSTCGVDGCGRWGFFRLQARCGKKEYSPGHWGGYGAEEDCVIELGTPRAGGDKFLPEDKENLNGTVTARVIVKEK